jgi:hypothetical protein
MTSGSTGEADRRMDTQTVIFLNIILQAVNKNIRKDIYKISEVNISLCDSVIMTKI